MSEANQLQLMVETHNVLVSLLIEYLLKYGQSMKKAMNTLPDTQVREDSIGGGEIELPIETRRKIDEATLNILHLISTEDEECLKSVNSYIKMLKEIAAALPKHRREEMPEGTRRVFDSLWEKGFANPSADDTMTKFSNALHSFYSLAE